jgi:hypothetical protein
MKPLLYLFADNSGINVDLPKISASADSVQTILAIVFAVAGALAVLMITISGFRYILSQGDSAGVSKAKHGIIYSLVGLIVCIVAEAIVAFVIGGV